MSLSPGFCGSHQVMLTLCMTWMSEVALKREAKLQRPWDPLGSHKARALWCLF